MDPIIQTVVASAPQQGATRFFLFDITSTKLGLAVITALAVLIINLYLEPPFLLCDEDDPILEARPSYVRFGLVSLVCGVLFLAIPTLARSS